MIENRLGEIVETQENQILEDKELCVKTEEALMAEPETQIPIPETNPETLKETTKTEQPEDRYLSAIILIKNFNDFIK